MSLPRREDQPLVKHNLKVYAEIEIELPSYVKINPSEFKVNLTKGFIFTNNKKKAPVKKLKINTTKKERVYFD